MSDTMSLFSVGKQKEDNFITYAAILFCWLAVRRLGKRKITKSEIHYMMVNKNTHCEL